MRKADEFFVGYLPVSAKLVTFYKVAIPLLITLALLVGVWLAYGQQSPGNAVSDLSEQQTLTGYLTVDPLPCIA